MPRGVCTQSILSALRQWGCGWHLLCSAQSGLLGAEELGLRVETPSSG